MSLLHNVYARSEQWRIEWGFRTCISVAVVTFLYLWSPTKDHLTRYGPVSTAYATVVTAFVKDITLGATLTNAWYSILGAFISTMIGWSYYLIVRQFYEQENPLLLTLLCIFIFVFILQFVEMVTITKKFAVGMIPLNLIGFRNEAKPSFYVWGLFLAVCIGSSCAMVGCVMPLPIRLANTELKERIYYYSEALSSLVNDMSKSWLRTYKSGNYTQHRYPIQAPTGRLASSSNASNSSPSATPDRHVRKHFREAPPRGFSVMPSATAATATATATAPKSSMTATAPEVVGSTTKAPPAPPQRPENPHWRKLRITLRAISIIKRPSFRVENRTFPVPSMRKFNTRFIRQELVNFLQEGLPFLLSRNQEAKFGPSRRVATRCSRYVKLIQDMLLIATKIDTHIDNMEKASKFHYLYVAYFSRPNLQYALSRYASALGDVIRAISNVLAAQTYLSDELLQARAEGFEAVHSAAALVQARTLFDREYLQARRDIFYPHTQHHHRTQPADVATSFGDNHQNGSGSSSKKRGHGQGQYRSQQGVRQSATTGAGEASSWKGAQSLSGMSGVSVESGTALAASNDSTSSRILDDCIPSAPFSCFPSTPPGSPTVSSRIKSNSIGTSGGARKEENIPSKALRVQAKAMIDLNSVLFLLDTMSRLLLEFWSLDDLNMLHKHKALNLELSKELSDIAEAGCSADKDEPASSTTTHFDDEDEHISGTAASYRKWLKLYNGAVTFLTELFPTKQSHLLCVSFAPDVKVEITKLVRARLLTSFKVATAMTLAALYGIMNNRPQASLASFTIAFLAGGAVSGINVMTCINRAGGTAVAAVYSIMVAFIISTWTTEWARNLFIGFAVVLMQLPATYLRSYPLYSYAGVVTGFTVALLLLQRQVSTEVAVNRIIDTFVAVFTYLVMEFAVAATFTENEIIGDMVQVFEGLEDRFINFHRNFQYFKAAEDTYTEARQRIRGGTLTPMEVDNELQRIAQLKADMKMRQQLEVESIQVLIRRQVLLAPYYRSEPAVFRPAVFPPALLQEAVTLQQEAANSIQIMIWAVRACDGSYNDQVESLVKSVHKKIQRISSVGGGLNVKGANFNWADRLSVGSDRTALSGTSGHGSGLELSQLALQQPPPPSPSGFTRNTASYKVKEVISILPEFKTLLLPLEPHFAEVERFVSAVLVFLTAAMERIGDWRPALDATSGRNNGRKAGARSAVVLAVGEVGVLPNLAAIAQARHAVQLAQITAEFPHTIYERLTYGNDDAFDAEEVDQLYVNYKDIVLALQRKLTTDGDGDGEGGGGGDGQQQQQKVRRIPSNREIIIVNTLLASTQQLISALHGLTSVVSRMQAHRDIHVTQDGKKAR